MLVNVVTPILDSHCLCWGSPLTRLTRCSDRWQAYDKGAVMTGLVLTGCGVWQGLEQVGLIMIRWERSKMVHISGGNILYNLCNPPCVWSATTGVASMCRAAYYYSEHVPSRVTYSTTPRARGEERTREQSRVEESRTEQSRAEERRANQSRAE